MKLFSLVIAALSFDRAFWFVNGQKESINAYEILVAGDGSTTSPFGEVFTLEPLDGNVYFETDPRWIDSNELVSVQLFAGVVFGELCDTGTLLVSSNANTIVTKYSALGNRETNRSFETATSNGIIGSANFSIEKYDGSLTSPIFAQGQGDKRGEITLCVRASLTTGNPPEVISFADTRMVVTIYLKGNFETTIALAAPSDQPSLSPSSAPSNSPSAAPSANPSQDPSGSPSAAPSTAPTVAPSLSLKPTFKGETFVPSEDPSHDPSGSPSDVPSTAPTGAPSEAPSDVPSADPSQDPSGSPSVAPSADPTGAPSLSWRPTFEGETRVPSAAPSDLPSSAPSTSQEPSEAPSISFQPTEAPSSSTLIYAGVTSNITQDQLVDLFFKATQASIAYGTFDDYKDIVGNLNPGRQRRLNLERLLGVDILVTADRIQCSLLNDNLDLVDLDQLAYHCFGIFITITATTISPIQPVVEIDKIEGGVVMGSFADELNQNSGFGLVTQLPPSFEPSTVPSSTPTLSYEPSSTPSAQLSSSPSAQPTKIDKIEPTFSPSAQPTKIDKIDPTSSPSAQPTKIDKIDPTSSPSAQPTKIDKINCANDPSFRLNGNRRKDCNWVFRKLKKRCNRKQKATKKSVRFYCPLSCKKKCISYKTASPSSAPTINICGQDNSDYQFENNPEKDCLWASKRPDFRCRKKDKEAKNKRVFKFCKSGCNLRCACKNTKKTFKIDLVKTKCKEIKKTDCDKVATKGKSLRIRTVSHYCPRKCEACLVY